MSAIIKASIDLSKIDKSRIVTGKNGRQYYDFTIAVNDETSQYGDNASIFDSQTKEQRDAKADRNYLGNGRVVFVSGDGVTIAEKVDRNATPSATNNAAVPQNDGLPF